MPKPCSEETAEKLRAVMIGRVMSEDVKRRISETKRKQFADPVFRERHLKKTRETVKTEEWKEAHLKGCRTEERNKKLSESLKKYWQKGCRTEERNKKLSESLKKYWQRRKEEMEKCKEH